MLLVFSPIFTKALTNTQLEKGNIGDLETKQHEFLKVAVNKVCNSP